MLSPRTSRPPLEVVETGNEPEYVINCIARAEPAGSGTVRLFMGSRRSRTVKVEFSVVVTLADLASMASEGQAIAADTHNLMMWQDDKNSEQ